MKDKDFDHSFWGTSDFIAFSATNTGNENFQGMLSNREVFFGLFLVIFSVNY